MKKIQSYTANEIAEMQEKNNAIYLLKEVDANIVTNENGEFQYAERMFEIRTDINSFF
jgi:hypothetical protein